MSSLIKYIVFAFLCFLVPQTSDAQSRTVKKTEKEQAHKKAKRAKDDSHAEEELQERHLKNQSKEVRKRMKKNRKRAKRINNNKGPRQKFSIKRLFKK